LYTDAIGTRSARADGFQMLNLTMEGSGTVSLLLIHPHTKTIENYNFQIDGKGNGIAAWTSIKSRTMFPKTAVYHAKCSGM
jgi:hypothetical protein